MLELFLILSFACIFLFFYQELQATQAVNFFVMCFIYLLNYTNTNFVGDTELKYGFMLSVLLTGVMLVFEKYKGEKQ